MSSSSLTLRKPLLVIAFTVLNICIMLITINTFHRWAKDTNESMVLIKKVQTSQNNYNDNIDDKPAEKQVLRCNKTNQPKVWIVCEENDDYLSLVNEVFLSVGYETTRNDTWDGNDWDVMWALDYPFFDHKDQIHNMKPHQRINHLPGTGYAANKVLLATSDIKNVPKAFQLPQQTDQLLAFSEQHPDMMWVQKGNAHQGVEIKSVSQMDLSNNKKFVQQYVADPLLIDGYRFDIGIYTAIASVDPLRVYIFNDWHFRFCPEKYNPFDPDNPLKYVVKTETYIGPWDIPSFNKYFNGEDFRRKETFFLLLKEMGFDGRKLEIEISETIKDVFLSKEALMADESNKYDIPKNFFELYRIDFILDKSLNVYLMEVNMSPSLHPRPGGYHKVMMSQVVHSFLNLVGVARPRRHDFIRSTGDEKNMVVSSKDIRVYTESCTSGLCDSTCRPKECKFCKGCLTTEVENILKTTYLEHISKHGFQRVFPSPFESQMEAQNWDYSKDQEFLKLTDINQRLTLWFHGKCMQDAKWCS